jgi:HAMP domain-containing protein
MTVLSMRGNTRNSGIAPWIWALFAVLAVLAWQGLTVHTNYAANWTGLFRTGSKTAVPQDLAPGTFRNRHPAGYDGQFYRFLAHDPFLRRGTAACLDAPVLRARRILVPLLAWALAGGRQGAIDAAYAAVILASIFAGAGFLGSIMVRQGRHAAFGLLFLAVPATIVAADTMTVDVALGALTACFAWLWLGGPYDRLPDAWTASAADPRILIRAPGRLAGGYEPGWGLWFALAAAGLVRETGLLLAAACILAAMARRDYRRAAFWGTAALPALAWYAYLHFAIPPAGAAPAAIPPWAWPRPQLGIVMRVIDLPRYPLLGASVARIVRTLDVFSLLAMMGAAALGFARMRTRGPAAIRAALGLQVVLLLAMTDKGFWTPPYGYCRPFAPLFVLLLAPDAAGLGRRAWLAAILVCALVDARVMAEMETQGLGVLRWLGWS